MIDGNRLRQVEMLDLRRLGEVGRVEELLEADDLRALARRVANKLHRARDVGVHIAGRMVLDDADRERLAWHCEKIGGLNPLSQSQHP